MLIRCNKLKISKDDKCFVDISFDISESLAIIGHSGSGKSLTLKGLLDLLPKGFVCELDISSPFELKKGDNLSFVPQNPFTELSPMTKIKNQFFLDNPQKKLEYVNLNKNILDKFPSELSGGEIQRVVIALSLLDDLKLILLDEPTTALDVKNRENIINLLKDLQQKMGFLILFVSHDIKSASSLCKNVAVLRDGEIIEYGDMENVLASPKELYTKELKESHFGYRGYRC